MVDSSGLVIYDQPPPDNIEIKGVTQLAQTVASKDICIDVSGLKKGLYFIFLLGDDSLQPAKLVIQ